ncbi:MAG: hypothetical protein ACI8WB_001976 [Phenylobacterium sp.]|jgi:hypothetical protein
MNTHSKIFAARNFCVPAKISPVILSLLSVLSFPLLSASAMAANSAPVAVDDVVHGKENTKLWIVNPVANDYDLDGDKVSLDSIASKPAHGKAFQIGNNIQYIPNPGFSGSDSFSYHASDSETTVLATIIVNITANGIPIAVNDQASGFNHDAIWINNPVANDSDPDGDKITLKGIGSQPTNGKVYQVGNNLRYTANPGFVGVDSFAYTIADGSSSARGTITVTVNEQP